MLSRVDRSTIIIGGCTPRLRCSRRRVGVLRSRSLAYGYDMRSQLIVACVDNVGSSYFLGWYAYDKAGNITFQTIGQTQTSFAYDGDLMTDKGNEALD